jgi:hypothetical protein
LSDLGLGRHEEEEEEGGNERNVSHRLMQFAQVLAIRSLRAYLENLHSKETREEERRRREHAVMRYCFASHHRLEQQQEQQDNLDTGSDEVLSL